MKTSLKITDLLGKIQDFMNDHEQCERFDYGTTVDYLTDAVELLAATSELLQKIKENIDYDTKTNSNCN